MSEPYYHSEKTLFSLDGWEIKKTIDRKYAFQARESIIYHACSKAPTHYGPTAPFIIVYLNAIDRECGFCDEPPPPEIQALWQLQNMDLI